MYRLLAVIKRPVRTLFGNRGFTLVETIISIVVFGIISVLLVRVFVTGAKVYENIINSKEIQDNLYLAQRRFSNDVFGVRDSQHLLIADNSKFKFVDSRLDTIQYRYSSGNLFRQENSASEYTVAQYLTDSTTFYYYTNTDSIINENPLSSSSLLSIWRVRLDLYSEKGTQTMKIQTGYFPRNLKYGVVTS